ncbi:hypothetical protein FACS189497_14780 [Betaproteobacteria bacterium]|nr:hypothetical protein FACS189497_14780 [Betaproteobacteria bacterium]
MVCDWFSDATYAYQVGGHGLEAARCEALEAWVHPQRQPDLTLLFDLPPEVAAARVAASGAGPDRFEREQRDFFERVRAAYLAWAARDPGRFQVIDAVRPPASLSAEIGALMTQRGWL